MEGCYLIWSKGPCKVLSSPCVHHHNHMCLLACHISIFVLTNSWTNFNQTCSKWYFSGLQHLYTQDGCCTICHSWDKKKKIGRKKRYLKNENLRNHVWLNCYINLVGMFFMWSSKQFLFLFFSFIMGSLEFCYYSFLTQHTTEPFGIAGMYLVWWVIC